MKVNRLVTVRLQVGSKRGSGKILGNELLSMVENAGAATGAKGVSKPV